MIMQKYWRGGIRKQKMKGGKDFKLCDIMKRISNFFDLWVDYSTF